MAGEMEREGFTIPLLIGGATTSRVHTAVKIEPHYKGPTVHVLDASRAVGVAGSLLSDTLRDGFVADVRERVPRRARAAEPAQAARSGGSRSRTRGGTGSRSIGPAPRRRCPARPASRCSTTTRSRTWCRGSTGRRSSRPGSCRATTRPFSTDPTVGPAATSLFARCAGAARPDRARTPAPGPRRVRRLPRQRRRRRHRAVRRRGARAEQLGGDPHPPAADAQAARPPQPRAGRLRGAARDAAWPTTWAPSPSPPARGSTRWWPRSRRAHDDYSAILAKALADRLAEAFAERLHERVRREYWGYAPDEALDNAGARPRAVPGDPAGTRATPPAPTTPRSGPCSICCERRPTRGSR